MNLINFFAGTIAVIGTFGILVVLFKAMTIQVEDEHVSLIMEFGRLKNRLTQPGLHFYPSKIFPWVKVVDMSRQRDYRDYHSISLNERNGTNVSVDLWVEFQIVDPEKALFDVENWEEAMRSLVVHSATSILCSRSFQEILTNRDQISTELMRDVSTVTQRWGINVASVLIKNVGLPTDVSRRILGSVSAKLERAKSLIEEEGRLCIEKLEAQTESEIAAVNAEAKSQYSLAVGRAYDQLNSDPEVLRTYQELYELSRVAPHKTVYFNGFDKEIRAIDAAMIAPSFGDQATGNVSRITEPQ